MLCDGVSVWGMIFCFIHCRREGMSSPLELSDGQRDFLTSSIDLWGRFLGHLPAQLPNRKLRQIFVSNFTFPHSSSVNSLNGEP